MPSAIGSGVRALAGGWRRAWRSWPLAAALFIADLATLAALRAPEMPVLTRAACGILQVVLAGGVFSVLRQVQPRFAWRGLAHAGAFYFGRLFRLLLVLLLLVAATRAAGGALFPVVLAAVAVFGTLAGTFLVVQDRPSAILALASALAFAVRRPVTILIATAPEVALLIFALQVFPPRGAGPDPSLVAFAAACSVARLMLMAVLVEALQSPFPCPSTTDPSASRSRSSRPGSPSSSPATPGARPPA